VRKGDVLTLAFEGGTSEAVGASQEVRVIPDDAHRVALLAMVPLLLVLLAVVGMTQRQTDPLSDASVLRTHYDALVKRLARLDDLRAADAISVDAHQAAREELTTRLGALALRLRALDEGAATSPPTAAQKAARARTQPTGGSASS
jgi:hypothetical protein